MAPAISVLLPVHNAEGHIDACLESVCSSSTAELEICIIDDGSTDGTPARLEAWAARDPRIQCKRQRNRGVAAARNALLQMASGDLFVLQDADDVSHRDRFAWIAESYDAHGWDLFHSRSFVINGHDEIRGVSHVLPPSMRLMRRGRNPIVHGSVAMRRDVVERAGGYSSETAAEDLELWLRLRAAGIGFEFDSRPIYGHRVHGESVSARSGASLRASVAEISGHRSPLGDPREIEQYYQLKVGLLNRQQTWLGAARAHPGATVRLAVVEMLGRLLAQRHRSLANGFPGLRWAA